MSYFRAIVIILLCAGLSAALRPYLEPLNLVMIFLFGMVLIAAVSGPWPTIVSSIVSIAVLDYFFIPPYGTFAVYENKYITAFVTIFLTSIVIAVQAERLRRRIDLVQKREKDANFLYEMAKELSSSSSHSLITEVACSHIAKVFDCKTTVLMPDDKGQLQKVGARKGSGINYREESVAEWAYQKGEMAGFGTKTLPTSTGLYLPLVAEKKVIGVLDIMPYEGKPFTQETLASLQTFTEVVAASLQRATIAKTAEKHKVEMEGERSRNVLLNSISHDLRTPLATIIGASENLEFSSNLDEAKEHGQSIHSEAKRLTKVLNNILQVTKLESGNLTLNKQPYFINELIGAALQRSKMVLGNRMVNVHLQENMPLVEVDGLLIEQVIVNLLENAAKYTTLGSAITILGTHFSKVDITISIKDSGPGIPEGAAEKVFEKFYREGRKDAPAGAGLGLAICKAIINTHGGAIHAENSPTGGAVFSFTLPILEDGDLKEDE